ncbi:hypothetical protein RIA_2048 [Riemerella anatipestifer RA-GD]|nr:hypothetical protein RIA_2048 [Riemerella anatipestifer RA-GD]
MSFNKKILHLLNEGKWCNTKVVVSNSQAGSELLSYLAFLGKKNKFKDSINNKDFCGLS